MRRILPALLLTLACAAALSASGCAIGSGDDELHWQLDSLGVETIKLPPATRHFTVLVELGCDLDDEARIDGYAVGYLRDDVVVTFAGKESDHGADCLTTRPYEVQLSEPIGRRALCDGSYEPPLQVYPGEGTPTTPKPGVECEEP